MKKHYGLVIDLNRCIGCHACTVACKTENGWEDEGSGVNVLTIGGEGLDWPSGTYPNLELSWLPISCMHCENAPCEEVCPTQAIEQRDDGVITIDQDKCIGCRYCSWACPYDALFFDAKKGVVGKCELCYHRIELEMEPACVEACVYGARIFGDLNDPNSKISEMIRSRHGKVLMPEQRTEPSVHYVGKGA